MVDAQKLIELADLRDSGVLTQAEFEQQKAILIADNGPAEPSPVQAAGVVAPSMAGNTPVVTITGAVVEPTGVASAPVTDNTQPRASHPDYQNNPGGGGGGAVRVRGGGGEGKAAGGGIGGGGTFCAC